VLAVVQRHTSAGRFLWIIESGYPDLWGPFQNRNNFATFVELLVPLSLWQSVRDRGNRAVWLGVAAALVAAVATSSSRAGSAIVVAEVLVVGAIAWRGRLLPRRDFAGGALMLAGMALAATLAFGSEVLWRRMSQPDPFGYRPEIQVAALSMVAARPWTGFGPGTFETVYPAYARFDIGQVVNHAHNDWLEWAAGGGIPFLLLLGAFAIRHLRPAVSSVWGIGVVGVFLHALVDYPFQRLGVAGWVFVMLAAIAAEHRSGKPSGGKPSGGKPCGGRLSLDHTHGPQAGHLAG
jgi:O-antigen ligase